jgi:hypothetical protein
MATVVVVCTDERRLADAEASGDDELDRCDARGCTLGG